MTDYLALLRQYEPENAQEGNCVNRVKGFTHFTQEANHVFSEHSDTSERHGVSPRSAAESAEVAELRRLLTDLMWDAPDEVEPEIERTLADGAMGEALTMYRTVWREYHQLGELPGQPNFRRA